MTDKKMNEYRKWFESKGYDFEDDCLWMEDSVTDHSWKDIFELIEDYVSERKQSTEVSNNADSKALSIADIVRSFSKENIISLLEDRKNHFKPKDYYKNERMRLTQAINTIKKLVPDF